MWKEFFPISMPSVAISLLSFCDMTCSLSSVPLASILAGRAGARPDHPISGPFWNLVAVLNDNFGRLGYLIVTIFVVSWAISIAVYQINRYDTIEVGRD